MNNKVTLEAIEANIKAENYFTAFDGAMGHYLSHPMAVLDVVNPELKRMTFCVLTLQNGFMVFGESSCVSLENYDEQLGRKYARENAVSKCWELMGYELKTQLEPTNGRLFEVEKHREPFPEAGGTIKFRRYVPSADSSMTFGMAIEALKAGKKVSRSGWNGKGMWLSLSGPDTLSYMVHFTQFWSENNADFAKECGGLAEVLPSITMITEDGKILMGWLASQTDMLAEDWVIVS